MSKSIAKIHVRNEEGQLEATDIVGEQQGNFKEGGGGVMTTCEDYMRFIQMVLNDGQGEQGRILKPQTIQLLTHRATGNIPIQPLKTIDLQASNDFKFFPGLQNSWPLGFMRNEEQAPTGRSAGSLG